MKEIWKDIEGYEGLYQISNLGRIKSLTKQIGFYRQEEKILCQKENNGYLYVGLSKNGCVSTKSVHRLVAETFLNKMVFMSMPNENKNKLSENELTVNHKNEIKNDNRVDNLEWCTNLYNQHYGTRLNRIANKLKGRKLSVENKNNIKKTARKKFGKKVIQYDLEGNFIKKWDCISEIEEKIGIKSYDIIHCCKGMQNTSKGYIWRYANE